MITYRLHLYENTNLYMYIVGTPILRTRTSPSSVGVVAPRQLDLSDPHILQYKIQADQVSSI